MTPRAVRTAAICSSVNTPIFRSLVRAPWTRYNIAIQAGCGGIMRHFAIAAACITMAGCAAMPCLVLARASHTRSTGVFG